MRLYHGTNTEHLPAIREHGLKDPCLTSDYEIACEYADVASGEGFPCVVSVEVDPSQLRIDWPSMSEPVGNSEFTGSQMDERVAAMFAEMREKHPERWDEEMQVMDLPDELYQASLDSVFTARAAGRVPVVGVVSTAEHRDTGRYGLFEVVGAQNYWLSPGSSWIETDDHLEWVLNNLDLSALGCRDGSYPSIEDIDNGETSFDLADLYDEAHRQGYVRVVLHDSRCVYGGNPKPTQLRELKNFAIERGVQLTTDGGRVVQETAASIIERYAGSDKERGIWYHGTSSKLLPSILSQGLIPYPKQRSWDKDEDGRLSPASVSLVSYGGVYLTQNLVTAISSSRRVYLRDKSNPLIVICAVQPRSLIADEDSFTNTLKGDGHTYGLLWQYKELIAPGRDTERATYLEDAREAWASKNADYLAPEAHPELRKRVHALLRGEGYAAMVTRTVSYHIGPGSGYSAKYDWEREWPREMQDAGTVPPLPAPEEGERVFRVFIDKLTRVLKDTPRQGSSFMKTARTEQPIRFSGSNRIIAVVELPNYNKYPRDSGAAPGTDYDVVVHYGTVPDDFMDHYRERMSRKFNVIQARARQPERERAVAEAVRQLCI